MAYVSAAIMEEDFTAHARAHVQNTKVHNYGSLGPRPHPLTRGNGSGDYRTNFPTLAGGNRDDVAVITGGNYISYSRVWHGR